MIRSGITLSLCVLGGVLFNTGAQAVVANTAGNPYRGIVERNLFALKPPPPPGSDLPPPAPAPKITLTGITTILGNKRVLFKVLEPARAGTPAKEEFFMMTEGESESDIEVMAIDQKAGTAKFNNHGVIQVLDMINNAAKATAGGPAPVGPAVAMPTMPAVAQPNTVAQGMVGAGPSMGTRQLPSRPMRGNAGAMTPGIGGQTPYGNVSGEGYGPAMGYGPSSGPNFASGGAPGGAQTTVAGQSLLTPEQQMIILEAQRAKAVQEGDPIARILPPTPMTPPGSPGMPETPLAPQ